MRLEFEIKRAVETGKVVLGAKQGIKLLANKKCKAVIYSRDALDMVKIEIKRLSKISGIPAIEIDCTSKQLGIICGKPFVVSVLSIVDPGYSNVLEEIKKISDKNENGTE